MSRNQILLVITDPERGTETTHELPVKYEVCTRCGGVGTHTNPAIDGNGITGSEMTELGPEFEADYFAGAYDIQCETCKGLRVTPVVDEEVCRPDLFAEYERQQQDDAEARYEMEADRRAELRAMGGY